MLKLNKAQLACVDFNSTIKEVIKSFEQSKLKICFILKKNKFYGVISDGDLRRAISRGYNIKSHIKRIINKRPIFVYKNFNKKILDYKLEKKNITLVPILDRSKKLLDIYNRYEDSNISIKEKDKKIPILLMAGGKGKRLYPLTKHTPKPLLIYKEKPIIKHIIDKAIKHGFSNFFISINYKKNKFKKYFKNINLKEKISFINEKKCLDTAGSIGLLNVNSNIFIVINSDLICDIDLNDLINYHKKNKGFATIVVRQHQDQNPFGVVISSGKRVIDIKEKPISFSNINAGIYVFDYRVRNFIQKNKKIKMSDLFLDLIKKNKRIIYYTLYENWLDLGDSIYKKLLKKNNI
jgi:dTDP-glucose pyrophosphorylase